METQGTDNSLANFICKTCKRKAGFRADLTTGNCARCDRVEDSKKSTNDTQVL